MGPGYAYKVILVTEQASVYYEAHCRGSEHAEDGNYSLRNCFVPRCAAVSKVSTPWSLL